MLTNSAPAKSSHAPAREMFKETPSLENMRLWVSWWVLLCVPSLQLQAGAAVFLLHCRVLRCRLFTTLDRFPWQPGCLHMKSNQLPQMRAFVSIVTITRRERENERENICPNKWPNLPKLITESLRKQIRSQPWSHVLGLHIKNILTVSHLASQSCALPPLRANCKHAELHKEVLEMDRNRFCFQQLYWIQDQALFLHQRVFFQLHGFYFDL